MKKRKSFVANSSSSSFIVISEATENTTDLKLAFIGQTFTIGPVGETEFGWSVETHDDCYSKINFAYLQTQSCAAKPHWLEMLEKVIKQHTLATDIEIKLANNPWGDPEEKGMFYGYIDHQSGAGEGENIEIFESEDNLRNFLFNGGSYLQTGNDNE